MFTTLATLKLNKIEKLAKDLQPAMVLEAENAIRLAHAALRVTIQRATAREYSVIVDDILRSVGRHVQEIVNAAIHEETKRQDPAVREVIKTLATEAAEEAGSAHYVMLKEELDAAIAEGDKFGDETNASLNAHALELQSLRAYCKSNELALANVRRQLAALKPKKKPAKKAPAKKPVKKAKKK